LKSNKILVVDDDLIVLESCKRVLEDEGFSVALASSAKEAIKDLENEYYDLMILDAKMPKHDGVYLLEKIKEKWPISMYPELPVVQISGYATADTISKGLALGAALFLAKPFTPDELVTTVNNVLKRRKKNGKSKSTGN
jgi:DNA-binding NtrC family response regulator